MDFSSILLPFLGMILHGWIDSDCVHAGYSVTKTAIYYCIDDGKLMYSKYKLEGVNMASFQTLNDSHAEYAKDKNSVFFYKKKVVGADPATFQMLNFEYNKDKNAVYHFETKMLGVNPATFKIH